MSCSCVALRRDAVLIAVCSSCHCPGGRRDIYTFDTPYLSKLKGPELGTNILASKSAPHALRTYITTSPTPHPRCSCAEEHLPKKSVVRRPRSEGFEGIFL